MGTSFFAQFEVLDITYDWNSSLVWFKTHYGQGNALKGWVGQASQLIE
jgi:hypothetical protein